jgi:hypothetical protein
MNKAITNTNNAAIELNAAILSLDLIAYMNKESENNPPTILSDTAITEDRMIDTIDFSNRFKLLLDLLTAINEKTKNINEIEKTSLCRSHVVRRTDICRITKIERNTLSVTLMFRILIPIANIETDSIPNMNMAEANTVMYGDDATALPIKCNK